MSLIKQWLGNKKNGLFILLFLILLPLLFINVKTSNGWGGDFSQYLHQAQNYCEGNPPNFQYYVYNERYSELAPSVYPVGFPIILAPVVCKYGIDFVVLHRFMSFLVVLACLSWFLFLAKHFDVKLAFIIPLILGYSSWLLDFKNAILSDIFVAILIALALTLLNRNPFDYSKKQVLKNIVLGLILGFALITKTSTFAIILPLFLYYLGLFTLNPSNIKNRKIVFSNLIIFILSIGLYFLNSKTHQGAEHISHFKNLFQFSDFFENVMVQVHYYYKESLSFLTTLSVGFGFFTAIWEYSLGFFLLYGIYKSVRFQKNSLYLLLLGTFLSMLLVFPHQQGYRYLLPATPLILFFLVYGMKNSPFSQRNLKRFYGFLFVFAFILPLRVNLVNASKNLDIDLSNGPESPGSIELYSFLKTKNPNSQLLFIKPRTLGLFTKMKVVCNNKSSTIQELEEEINTFGVDYLIDISTIDNKGLRNFIKEKENQLNLEFSNDLFKVYSLKERH